MGKVKVTIKRDGVETVIEGTPEEVARILRDLDRKELAPQSVPAIIVIPAPANPFPFTLPYTPGPIWAPAPSITPAPAGWPIITCEAQNGAHC